MFSDRQSSIGSESRLYPHRKEKNTQNNQNLYSATDSVKYKKRSKSAIGVQLEGFNLLLILSFNVYFLLFLL